MLNVSNALQMKWWRGGSHLEILELVLVCSGSLQFSFEKRVKWPAEGYKEISPAYGL